MTDERLKELEKDLAEYSIERDKLKAEIEAKLAKAKHLAAQVQALNDWRKKVAAPLYQEVTTKVGDLVSEIHQEKQRCHKEVQAIAKDLDSAVLNSPPLPEATKIAARDVLESLPDSLPGSVLIPHE